MGSFKNAFRVCYVHNPPEQKESHRLRFFYGALTEWPAILELASSCALLFWLLRKTNTYNQKEMKSFSNCSTVQYPAAEASFVIHKICIMH